MKIFSTTFFTFAVSIGCATFSEAADECPSTWTLFGNGNPRYHTEPDCECSSGFFKEDIGALFNQPGAFRCSKSDGEVCEDDYECGNSIDCIQGTCNGNGGVGQCPSVQGQNGASLCYNQGECECTDNGFTVRENLGTAAEPCYHCSKPMGADCSSRDECPNLIFNSNVMCFDGKCSVQCPTGQDQCGDIDCVCPTEEFPLQEERLAGDGCYRCRKPIGDTCTHFSECAGGANCLDNVCTHELPTCNAHDNTNTYDFQFVTTDENDPPCQCNDPAYPEVLVIEFYSNRTIAEGGGNFGFICTDGNVPECPNEFSFNDLGMAVRVCQPDTIMGVPNGCDCTMGDYTAKEELLDGCFRCAKPDGTMCSDDAECLDGSHCDDATGRCSSAPRNCESYDGNGDYFFGVFFEEGGCSGATCVCGDPAYPNLVFVEYDSNTRSIVAGGGSCGYVCAADS